MADFFTFDGVWFVNGNLHFIRNFLDDFVRLWHFNGVFLNFLHFDWVFLDDFVWLRN